MTVSESFFDGFPLMNWAIIFFLDEAKRLPFILSPAVLYISRLVVPQSVTPFTLAIVCNGWVSRPSGLPYRPHCDGEGGHHIGVVVTFTSRYTHVSLTLSMCSSLNFFC